MAKLKVADIFHTRRNLVRLEKYALRHMDNLQISEMNDKVAEARTLLASNVSDFDDMDIQVLSVDTTELEDNLSTALNRLAGEQEYLVECKKDRKHEKKMNKKHDENDDWAKRRVSYSKENIIALEEDIREMEEALDA